MELKKESNQIKLPDWLSELEVQQMLGCKTTKLWQLRSKGKIKSTKFGSKTFYKFSSILSYLESNISN